MNILGFNISRSPAKKSADEIPVSQLSPEALAWLAGSDLRSEGTVLANAYQHAPQVKSNQRRPLRFRSRSSIPSCTSIVKNPNTLLPIPAP